MLDAKALRRINRKLADSTLRVCRFDSRWFNDLGRYYLVSYDNVILETDVDLEELAAQLKIV